MEVLLVIACCKDFLFTQRIYCKIASNAFGKNRRIYCDDENVMNNKKKQEI